MEFDLGQPKQQVITRVTSGPIAPIQSNKNPISEYQSRYKPITDQKIPRTRKAFEAEQAEERVNYSHRRNIISISIENFILIETKRNCSS